MGKHYVITQLPFCLRVAFQIPTKLSIFIQKYFIPPLWPTVYNISWLFYAWVEICKLVLQKKIKMCFSPLGTTAETFTPF